MRPLNRIAAFLFVFTCAVFFLTVAAPAIAQAADAGVAAAAVDAGAKAGEGIDKPIPNPLPPVPTIVAPPTPKPLPPPSPEDVLALLPAILKVIGDFKAGGALAGVAGIFAMLTQLSKTDYFRKLLDDQGRAWVRPLALLVISAGGGVITALQGGAHPGAAALAGVLAGLTGLGLREVAKNVMPTERNRVNVDVDALAVATNTMKANAYANGASSISVARIDALPARKRFEAMVSLAKANDDKTPVDLKLAPPST